MPNVERMKDQLVAWGLIPQVWDMKDAGYSLLEAITYVYIAHVNGKAYPASKYVA